MNVESVLAFLAHNGAAIAQYVYAHANSAAARREFADRFDVPVRRVGRMYTLGSRLFGPCPTEEAALQRQARLVAEEQHLSLEVLLVISTGVGNLSKKADISAMAAFDELVRFAVDKSVDVVRSHVRAFVRSHNGDEVLSHKRWLRVSGHADSAGMRYLIARLDDDVVCRMTTRLHQQACRLRDADTRLTYQQAVADALSGMVLGYQGKEVPQSLRREGVILLPADGYRHNGDQWLVATDGAQIHVDDLASRLLADYGYAIVYDENCEPVNLYRTKRFANNKQRLMLAVDQLLCADPDCQRVVERGQMHHVTAWAAGGQTNLDNLVGVCPTHNACNDDDPAHPRNGRYQRDPDSGMACWKPPDGGQLQYNCYQIATKSGRWWAMRHFGKQPPIQAP